MGNITSFKAKTTKRKVRHECQEDDECKCEEWGF